MTNDHRGPPLALSNFDYALPPELIAQEPTPARTASRLLHVDGDLLTDLAFRDLPELVGRGDLVVLNNTRVMRARLFGYKSTGGRIEALIERIVEPNTAWSQIRASHMPKIGSSVCFEDNAAATVVDRNDR